jgi:hypothetical protein
MLKKFKQNWMAFKDIFKDENDVNEKSVIGFMSFAVMVIFAVADLVTGYFSKDLVINGDLGSRTVDCVSCDG